MKITKPNDRVLCELLKDSILYDISLCKYNKKEKRELQNELASLDQDIESEYKGLKESKTAKYYTIDNVSLITADISLKNKGYFYIFCLHVLEPYRSKGYGKLLMDKVKQDYFKYFFNLKLALHVRQNNAAAIRFYEREGFYIFKEAGRSYEMIYKKK